MPNFPALPLPIVRVGYTASFVGVGGDKSSFSVNNIDPETSIVDLNAMSAAAANLSNAGLYKVTLNSTSEIPINYAEVLDEAYAEVSSKAVFVFQDTGLNTVQITIPAPDASIFGVDGLQVNLANTDVLAFTDSVVTVLGGDYAVVRGYRSANTRSIPRSRYVPAIEEPGLGQLPPDAPGV